jgi:phospholipid transport system transporter-binding protein
MPARLQVQDSGIVAVKGDLDFASVTALLRESEQLFRQQPPSRIDLSGVGHSNSAGVALLVEWLRQARSHRWNIEFIEISPQMRAIARLADLDELLPVR